MSKEASPRAIRLVVVLNAVAFAFTETGMLPELPHIQRDLGGASTTVSALLESMYLVVAAVAAPTLGKLGDKLGKKGPLVGAIVTYMIGAIGAGLSPDVWVLIAARAVQGVGGAMFAISLAVLRDHVTKEELGVAIGEIVGGFGVGVTAGFGLSGIIASWFGWRWIFFIGAGLVLCSLVAVSVVVPKSEPHPKARVDVLSVALLASSLAAIVGALAFSHALGWGSAIDTLLLIAFPVLLGLWIWRDATSDHPLLDVKMLANPTVLLPNLGSMLSGVAAFALFFLVPRLVVPPRHLPPDVASQVHYGLGASRELLGAIMLPLGVGVLAGGPLGGAVGRRVGGKWPFFAGMASLALGCFFLALWHDAPIAILAWLLMAGVGFGAVVGSTGTFVAETVEPEQTSVAMALNSLVRLVGGSIGAQIVAAILAAAAIGGSQLAAREGAIVASLVVCASCAAFGAVLAAFVPTKA